MRVPEISLISTMMFDDESMYWKRPWARITLLKFDPGETDEDELVSSDSIKTSQLLEESTVTSFISGL